MAAEESNTIELDANVTTLVYISKLTGNGFVAGYGWLKEFAFDIPTALRRLADSIEKGKDSAGHDARYHPRS
jgi:hypothetical protein